MFVSATEVTTVEHMKIRQGFVSNSSSSSFIVAVKKSEVCPTCHRGSAGFLDRFSRDVDDYESSRLMANEVEEVIDAMKSNYGGDFEEVIGEEEVFRGILKTYTDNDYDVGYIRIRYGDESLSNEMDELMKAKKLVVLKDMN